MVPGSRGDSPSSSVDCNITKLFAESMSHDPTHLFRSSVLVVTSSTDHAFPELISISSFKVAVTSSRSLFHDIYKF